MKRLEGKISFALGSGLLLLLTLFALVLGVLTAYWPPVLYGVLAAESVGLWLLSWGVSLLPRKRWPVVLAPLAVWLWLLWRNWDAVCYGALIMLRQVTRVLSETFPIPEIAPALQVSAWEETVAVTWWLGLVLAVWALLLGWCTARRRCWWATVLLTLPPLLPALLAGQMPAWGSVILLTAVWMALLLQSSVRNTAAAGRQLWVVLPTALAALLLLTVLFPREGYVHPAWTADARGAVLGWFDGLQETVSQGGGASGERVNLAAAGPLRYSGRTMLRVDSEVSGHFFLRGSAFGIYTGTSWENDDGSDFPEGEDNVLFLPASRTMNSLLSSQFPAADMINFASMVITPVGDHGSYLYSPYQPVGPVEDSMTADRDIGIVSLAEDEGSYRIYYVPITEDSMRIGELSVYSEYVYDHYLNVPEELESRLLEVLNTGLNSELTPDIPAGIPGRYQEAIASADVVAQSLALWAEYDPDTPRTPSGEDFVANFLSERRGYCMHFASTGTLLLRLMDIPARYVTGYSVDIPDSGEAEVADSAAHAWVEIYLEDYGWYPVDVTPGYGEDEEEQEVVTPEDGPEDTPDQLETEPEEIPEPDIPEETPEAAHVSIPAAVWVPVLLVLALVLWHFGLAALRRRRLTQPDTNRAVIAAYRSMERMERWGGRVDPRLAELAGKARFSQYTLTEEERAEALHHLEETARALEDGLPRWGRPVFRWLWGRR